MSITRQRRGFALVIAVVVLAAVVSSLLFAVSRVQGQRTIDHLTQRRLQSQETAQLIIDHIASALQSLATTSLATLTKNESELIDPEYLDKNFGTTVSLLKRGQITSAGRKPGLRIGDHILFWNLMPVRVYDRVVGGSDANGKLTESDLTAAGADRFLVNSNPDPGKPAPVPSTPGTKGDEPKLNMLYELVVDCFALPAQPSVLAPRIHADDFDPYVEIGQECRVQVRRMVQVSIKRLFEYVIFYNASGPAGDIEFGNNPPLEVTGSIHSNGAIYIGGSAKNRAPNLNLASAANSGTTIDLGRADEPNMIEGCDGIFRLRKVSNYHTSWYQDGLGFTFDCTKPLTLMPNDNTRDFNGISTGGGDVRVRLNGVVFTSRVDSRAGDNAFNTIDPRALYIKDNNSKRKAVLTPIQQRIGGGFTSDRPLEPFTIIGNPAVGADPTFYWIRPDNLGVIGRQLLWSTKVANTPPEIGDLPANESLAYFDPTNNRPEIETRLFIPNERIADLASIPVAATNRPWNQTAIGCQPYAIIPAAGYNPPCVPPPRAELAATPAGDSYLCDYFTNLSNAGPNGGLRPALNAWIQNALGANGPQPQTKAGITILERGIRNKTHHISRIQTVIEAWAARITNTAGMPSAPRLDMVNVANRETNITAMGELITEFAVTGANSQTRVNALRWDPAAPRVVPIRAQLDNNGAVTGFVPATGNNGSAVTATLPNRGNLAATLNEILPYTMGTMVPNTDFNNSSLEYFPAPAVQRNEYPAGTAYASYLMDGYCHAMRSHFVVYFGCDTRDSTLQRFNDITCQFFSHAPTANNRSQLRAYLAETISQRETGWARLHSYIALDQRISISLLSLNVGAICDFVRNTPLADVWPWAGAGSMSTVFNGVIYAARTPRLFGSGNPAGFNTTAAPDIPLSVGDNRPWQTLESAQCNGWWNPKAPLGFNPVASYNTAGNLLDLPMQFFAGGVRSANNVAAAFFGGLNQANPAQIFTTWPVIGDTINGTVNHVVGRATGGKSIVTNAATTRICDFKAGAVNAEAWTCFPAMPLRVRIENAATIDWGGTKASSKTSSRQRREGLTIYTPQVAYIRGNFNINNPETATVGDRLYPPCSLYADSVVVHSNRKADNVSNGMGADGSMEDGTAVNNRRRGEVIPGRAENTTYRLSIVTNNIPTDRENSAGYHALTTTAEDQQSGNGSGELENVLRLEEGWGGLNFTFEGSLVVFGRARYTRWNNEGKDLNDDRLEHSQYFGAPNRIYQYTDDLLSQEGQPPFAPFVVKVDTW